MGSFPKFFHNTIFFNFFGELSHHLIRDAMAFFCGDSNTGI